MPCLGSAGVDAFEANVHADSPAPNAPPPRRPRARDAARVVVRDAGGATPHAEPLRMVRDQLESTLHQLRRVSARVLAPDAHRPPAEPVADGAKYASALYGQTPLPGEAWSETLGE